MTDAAIANISFALTIGGALLGLIWKVITVSKESGKQEEKVGNLSAQLEKIEKDHGRRIDNLEDDVSSAKSQLSSVDTEIRNIKHQNDQILEKLDILMREK